jgi:hypothetical protein
MGQELLAWSQYPEPFGTTYFESDLTETQAVIKLLDLAQIHRATITGRGWRFFLDNHGIGTLLELNRGGRWFDGDYSLAADQILHRARLAGFEPAEFHSPSCV